MLNIYMIMAAMVLLLALLLNGHLPKNKTYIVWACVLMFAVYGLRNAYLIGNDSSSSYLHMFQDMKDLTWQEVRESGELSENVVWKLFMKLIHSLTGGDYQIFITLISAFVMLVFGRFIYRYSVSPVQSFIYYWGLWFYTFNFNALKQSVAMTFLLLAFDMIIEKKPIRFLLLTGIATLFHFPAIVFLPAYLIAKLNFKRGFFVLLALAFGAVYLWRDAIMDYMLQFYYYDDKSYFIGEDRFLTGKVTVMILLIVIANYLRPPGKEDHVYMASMQFVAIASVIQLFSVYNNVFERLADYYFQFSVIFVPFIFDPAYKHKTQKRKELFITVAPYILGVLCVLRLNDMVQDPSAHLLPYKFFFQQEEIVEQVLMTMKFI